MLNLVSESPDSDLVKEAKEKGEDFLSPLGWHEYKDGYYTIHGPNCVCSKCYKPLSCQCCYCKDKEEERFKERLNRFTEFGW